MKGGTSARATCRIGVDVGGTFTDFVLIDRGTGNVTYYKEPSTPPDPSEAVETGISGLLARAGVRPEHIELIVHGTTLGLNTIIQRKGAKVALLVSRGNRDIMEIARSRMPSSYDLRAEKEVSLVPRDCVRELPARTRADGVVISEPSKADLDDTITWLKQGGFDAVAVTFINSYLYPELEAKVVETLRAALPSVLVTSSAQLWPEVREYERALVATLNSYIHPLLEGYTTRLQSRLSALGMHAPVYITGNNGGTMGLRVARERPIDTVLSGPASGVVAGARVAELCDIAKIITLDMGGTSCDIAVSKDGTPEYSTRTSVGDFPLMLPVVNVSAIGAGGGSIVWVDPQGVLKVGPESAGASPGPICYGRGGTRPTITDCYLAIGLLRPDGFLGGRMSLDRQPALAGLEAVGERLGITGTDAAARVAEAAINVATAKMTTELYKHLAQRGYDPREYTMIAYGGAGPSHANYLAEDARLLGVLIPPSPGTLCALGASLSDLKRDYVRTIRRTLVEDDETRNLLRAFAEQMEREAAEWLQQEGDIVGSVAKRWTADLRYVGEGQEMTVAIPDGAIDSGTIDAIAEAFHRAHEAVYWFRDAENRVELMTLRMHVVATVPPIDFPGLGRRVARQGAPAMRRVFDGGAWQEARVYQREELHEDARLAGPALVEQEDTTTWIRRNWVGRVRKPGIILIER